MRIPRQLAVIAITIVLTSVVAIAVWEFARPIGTPRPELAAPPSAPEPAETEATVYGNREKFFARSLGGVLRPDPDWRDVLADWLAEAEPKWSQGFEELIIRDHFGDRKGGFFLDVGCAWPRKSSTTCYLEEDLHWSGIGVDVVPEFGETWKTERPNSKFICSAVSDTDGEKLTLYIGAHPTLDKDVARTFKPDDTRETEVITITLNTLLEQNGVERLDFLSMDIEGAEPAALKGFDIQRYKPSLCCVEAGEKSPTYSLVTDYFTSNGYELIEKYRKVDKVNLYFRPSTEQ